MRIEARTTFGRPCLVLIMESQEDSRMIDDILGDCGKDPEIRLAGTVGLDDADEPGPNFLTHFVVLWNPNRHDDSTVGAPIIQPPSSDTAHAQPTTVG